MKIAVTNKVGSGGNYHPLRTKITIKKFICPRTISNVEVESNVTLFKELTEPYMRSNGTQKDEVGKAYITLL